jgi:hypothetical protein
LVDRPGVGSVLELADQYVKNAVQDKAREKGDGKDDPKDAFFVVMTGK